MKTGENDFIETIITDIDGSMMPQGGPIDKKFSEFIYFLANLIKIGPATGKNVDYGRGLACGIGIVWNFVIGENGAQFLETISKESPPVYRHHKLIEIGPDLSEFASKINLDPFQRIFSFKGGKTISYRPELKESMISMFPAGKDLNTTEEWVSYFENIIRIFGFDLKVMRYSDGCVDIVPMQISKDLGVQQVCRLYGIERKNVLVIVDGKNDLELTLGTRVLAVGNAVSVIKDAATKANGYIATRNDGMGFVEGILHFAEEGCFREEIAQKIIYKVKELKIL